ncbi:MAG: type I restriction enzyme HsdR N-terminal domain-containing protein [Bacteroidota bacterium]|nr:type I restriction enzyme HsdR N-terminal domain-containing protein [Bacteroidota bacterium]
MTDLNLPSFEAILRRQGDKYEIFDPVRKKYIILTPEEWVRQHFVNYLVNYMNYPKSLIKLEGGLKYNSLAKRSDIVVYDRKGIPFMLVECKSKDVKLTQKVVEQISVYNKKISAPYQVITNGLIHFCFKMDNVKNSFIFLEGLPDFEC